MRAVCAYIVYSPSGTRSQRANAKCGMHNSTRNPNCDETCLDSVLEVPHRPLAARSTGYKCSLVLVHQKVYSILGGSTHVDPL